MLQVGEQALRFFTHGLDGTGHLFPDTETARPTLLVFFETDCPTCQLTFPYLNTLAQHLESGAEIIAISQDAEGPTRDFVEQMGVKFPVLLDHDLSVSRHYDPIAVPTLFLLDRDGRVIYTQVAFDKRELNRIAEMICEAIACAPLTVANPYDGAPESQPGCISRHLEPQATREPAVTANLYAKRGMRASHIELPNEVDPIDYFLVAGFDPLPVIPPTLERVEQMLRATAYTPDQIIARVPPNYGAATVEKIAANAVMAGCRPGLMRVLIPLVRAACDERFNLHGIQATTHFAVPLVIINGPIRRQLGFASGSNVFSNVARANSTLGRALQLILTNIGGARPGEIDMSTLGNPGKFAYCIAENEEESPWDPLNVEMGFQPDQSTLTLFAAEPPRGVSEHNARHGRTILKSICYTLATVFTYRFCSLFEAFVILCPEHVKTLARDEFSKQDVRDFLFENTGVPLRAFDDQDAEGSRYTQVYERVTIDDEPCYRKFSRPDQIRIVVAGGTAGKFSAVIGSWATGPRGSQVVTYPIE
jgi:peroxiredoxin